MLSKKQTMNNLALTFNKKIILEKYSTYQNENGFDIEDWRSFKVVWASINNLYGKEFYAAKTVNAETTVEFTIRYFKALEQLNTKEYRIIWNNRIFNITFIDNIKYENKLVKIKAIDTEGLTKLQNNATM